MAAPLAENTPEAAGGQLDQSCRPMVARNLVWLRTWRLLDGGKGEVQGCLVPWFDLLGSGFQGLLSCLLVPETRWELKYRSAAPMSLAQHKNKAGLLLKTLGGQEVGE